MPPLKVYAGAKARTILQSEAFDASLFTHFLGPSGGPKWFVLAGLDKALFRNFFNRHCGHMNIIGSSSGAFRAACFAQNNPAVAIDKLANKYAKIVYSTNPSAYEITEKAKEMVRHFLPPQGIIELMENDSVTVHIIASRCKHIMQSEGRLGQILGLAASAGLNAISRSNLAYLYERVIFSSKENSLRIHDPAAIPTSYIKMGYNTVADALLASGSIPYLMQGIRDIVDAPNGVYRDGGILDYHFDFGFEDDRGLTLYPHFYPSISPGWFDKHHKRAAHQASYDKVVMLVPSEEFVASLPYQKIPDRSDFKTMHDRERITYWLNVISESEKLGDYFLKLVEQRRLNELIEPFPFELLN